VIVLVAIFFVSGADAASIVMGMLSCRGVLEPPRLVVALWGTLMGGVAIVLLLAGGLASLQQAAIIVGAPFTLVLVGLAVSLYRSLRAEVPVLEPAPVVTIPEPGAARPGQAAGS
jgi:glycine betaine transporter